MMESKIRNWSSPSINIESGPGPAISNDFEMVGNAAWQRGLQKNSTGKAEGNAVVIVTCSTPIYNRVGIGCCYGVTQFALIGCAGAIPD